MIAEASGRTASKEAYRSRTTLPLDLDQFETYTCGNQCKVILSQEDSLLLMRPNRKGFLRFFASGMTLIGYKTTGYGVAIYNWENGMLVTVDDPQGTDPLQYRYFGGIIDTDSACRNMVPRTSGGNHTLQIATQKIYIPQNGYIQFLHHEQAQNRA